MTGLTRKVVEFMFSDLPFARQEIHQRFPCCAWMQLTHPRLLDSLFPHTGLPGWEHPWAPEQGKQGAAAGALPMGINLSRPEMMSLGTTTWPEPSYSRGSWNFQKYASSLQESQNVLFKTATRCLAPLDCRVISLLKIHETPIYIFRCLNLSSVLTLCPPELKNNPV